MSSYSRIMHALCQGCILSIYIWHMYFLIYLYFNIFIFFNNSETTQVSGRRFINVSFMCVSIYNSLFFL